MDSRILEIEAELEGLNKEGERILAHLEALKVQFDRGLTSRLLYEKTVEEARARLVSIDERIPVLVAERERLDGKGGSARAGAATLEPPVVRSPPSPGRALPPAGAPAPPPELIQKTEEALSRAQAAYSEANQLKPVLGAFAARVAALEDLLKGVPLPELRDQVRQLMERQTRLEAFTREMDRTAKAEFQRFADILKPVPVSLEKLQEDISTARIEIKALKYEAEAMNTLQEDRLRTVEDALGAKKK